MNEELKPGDYVLATKYHDGSPGDHFFVGFFSRKSGDRYIVEDNLGVAARASGFRRAEKISPCCGAFIVAHLQDIELGNKSLWSIKRNWEKMRAPVESARGEGR